MPPPVNDTRYDCPAVTADVRCSVSAPSIGSAPQPATETKARSTAAHDGDQHLGMVPPSEGVKLLRGEVQAYRSANSAFNRCETIRYHAHRIARDELPESAEDPAGFETILRPRRTPDAAMVSKPA